MAEEYQSPTAFGKRGFATPAPLRLSVFASIIQSPLQGLENSLWAVDLGRYSRTRFALGYYLSGLQPLRMQRRAIPGAPTSAQISVQQRFEYLAEAWAWAISLRRFISWR